MANHIIGEELKVVGLDVGDRQVDLCVLGLDGGVEEFGQIKTTEEGIAGRFGLMPRALLILEAGTHSPWINRLLKSLGHKVIVADPGRLRLIAKSINKSDKKDSEVLARVGRLDLGMLNPVYHRSVQAQADLTVVRMREQLVQARTKLLNAVRSTVKTAGGRIPACDADQFAAHATPHLPRELRPALLPLVETITTLTQKIKGMDREMKTIAKERYPIAVWLQEEISGVGPVTALAYVLVVEDPERFERSRDVGPYFGTVPKRRQSGQRAPELGITKAGDRLVRALAVQCAQYMLGGRGIDSDLRRWGLARMGESKAQKKRVIVAVARKILVLMHRLWTTGAHYDPLYQVHAKEAKEAQLAAVGG
jgi:transposase